MCDSCGHGAPAVDDWTPKFIDGVRSCDGPGCKVPMPDATTDIETFCTPTCVNAYITEHNL